MNTSCSPQCLSIATDTDTIFSEESYMSKPISIVPGGPVSAASKHIRQFWNNLPELTAATVNWSDIIDLLDENGEIDCTSWVHTWFNDLRTDSLLNDDMKMIIASKIEKVLTTCGWTLTMNGSPADFSDTATGKIPCTAADKCTIAPVVGAPTP